MHGVPHWGTLGKMQTVAETPTFQRRAEKLLSRQEHQALITYLAHNAEQGVEIPGTKGVRKIRYAGQGLGKSGGYRVIYYYYNPEVPLYALLIYGKGEQVDLTSEQRRQVAAFAEAIKATARSSS